MPSEYPEIDRSRTPDQLRQRGYLPEAGEWRGVGPKRVHSIPPGMDPSLVAKSDRVPPWVEKGYPNTKKGYQQYLDSLEGPSDAPDDLRLKREDLPYPPGDKRNLPLLEENWRGIELERREKLKQKPKSLLDSAWGPYAATSNMLLGKGKEALAMIDQYLKENPETISGLVGPGSAGPVGMVFKRGVPLATQLAKTGGVPSKGNTPLNLLTENPTTWFVDHTKAKTGIPAKDANRAKRAAELAKQGKQEFYLNPAFTTEGGPAHPDWRMTTDKPNSTAHIDFGETVKGQRGQGFFGELVRAALRKLQIEGGYKTVTLDAAPWPVQDDAGKAVISRTTGEPLTLPEMYEAIGFTSLGKGKDGYTKMELDLSKWPPKSKAVAAYEAHARKNRRMIETMDPNHRAPDVPPTEGGTHFVPEEVPREVDGLEAMRNERDAAAFRRRERNSEYRQEDARWINRSILSDRVEAPADIIDQYTRTGRIPEGWMSPSAQAFRRTPTGQDDLANVFERARDYYAGRYAGPGSERIDRGRPDPGESWSDYLARIRGLQR